MRICLFEDRRAADLAPLTLTRPAFELLCGLTPLVDKHVHYFAPDALGYLVRPLVADLLREAHPDAPVNDPLWLRAGPTVLVNARWLPPARAADQPVPTTQDLFASGPFLAVCDGELAFAAVGPELLAGVSPSAVDECLEDWLTALPRQKVGGAVVRRPWDLVDRNSRQIIDDFLWAAEAEAAGGRPPGVALVGPADRLVVDPSARLDPMVAIDTTAGPVVVGAGAVVGALSHLVGPCFVGPGTHVLGGRIKAGTSLGPHCRVGGEVEASIVQGYSNKAHDGFLGHSFVGEWVNLAAGTHTGDLRNDYGTISVSADGVTLNTGRVISDSDQGRPCEERSSAVHAAAVAEVAAAVDPGIAVDALAVPAGQRHADAVAVARHRREVAGDHDDPRRGRRRGAGRRARSARCRAAPATRSRRARSRARAARAARGRGG